MPKPIMKTSKRWLTPLDIPAGKSGDCEVVHDERPAGAKVMLGNLRTAMFGQGAPRDVSWPFPTRWHKLLIDGGTMMSDWPIEQRQHDESLRGFRGRVLVGGLGLGYAATVLLRRRSVTSVTVVEISADVIKLVQPFTRDPDRKLTVVHADLYEWLKTFNSPRFDYGFFDTWASDGEGTFFHEVCSLYQLTGGRIRRPPVCWNEDVMRGQLVGSLFSRKLWLTPGAMEHLGRPKGWLDLWVEDGTDRPWHNWCVPFFRWWKERQPSDELFEYAARFYAGWYGKWDWETHWKAFQTVN